MIRRRLRKLITKKLPAWALLGAMLLALMIIGCASGEGPDDGRDPGVLTATEGAVEREAGDSGSEHGDSSEGSKPGGEGNKDGSEHGGRSEGSEPGEEVNEAGSEHGGRSEGSEPGEEVNEAGSENVSDGEGGRESREAATSSPITPLGQSWNGVLGGLAVSAQYDAETRSVRATVRNTLSEKLCYVQAEPHLKSGTKTVGELGPEKLGHLSPEQEVSSSLTVADEPELGGVSYDGYVVHMEVFDCTGPGPAAHTGEDPEGVSNRGAGGEHGNESTGGGGEEGDGAYSLTPDETYDAVRSGARLILDYDAARNSFRGTVENTTQGALDRVRIEVHLSNGAELGPTTPTDMAPGEMMEVYLPATPASFTGWTAHAEVGGGGEGSESGGEHGAEGEHGGGSESGGEHGEGRESDREHGKGG